MSSPALESAYCHAWPFLHECLILMLNWQTLKRLNYLFSPTILYNFLFQSCEDCPKPPGALSDQNRVPVKAELSKETSFVKQR